jgi:tetratricopeptide (TPR) repeat protein
MLQNLNTTFAVIMILGWAPLVTVLFVLLPARRAMMVGSIAAWLLLPPIGFDFPGLPNYNKATAATAGILLGTLIFELNRLLAFRPRWFDLPMLLWSLCPFFSSISNELGAYDGLSSAFKQTIDWFLPYLVGRLYLTDAEGLREFALGIITGGVCLIPFTLFEIRMSPLLLPMVYGLGGWEGIRYGGYRPRVFFTTAIEFGLLMNCVTLIAWWTWKTGQLKRLLGLPGGVIFAALLVTTIACRATGSMLLSMSGLSALWICWRTKTKWVMWGLLLVGPVYYAVRVTDAWSGRSAVELCRVLINEERAHSLEYRLGNEDLFIAKVWQRPILGWGGWGRNDVYDGDRQITAVDGRWIIALGNYGLFGLFGMTTALLLPAALFFGRFPVQQWDHPSLVPATAIALVLNIFVLDGLFNGMNNILYIIAAGGLANVISVRTRPSVKISALSADARVVAQYLDIGRTLKDQGRFAEAKTAWLHALDLLTKRPAAQPVLPVLDQPWCDCANDLAWLLATAPDPAVRDPILALSLASKATDAHPKCGTYWNTLGAAQYRAGDFEAVIATLGQATVLNEGGTAFDHFFLAMAHAHLSNQEQAQRWFGEAMLWMEQHAADHMELVRLREEARSTLPTISETSVTAR